MSRLPILVALGTLASPALAAPEAATDAALMREEIRAMRADYETRIRQLEARLAQLEQKDQVPAAGKSTAGAKITPADKATGQAADQAKLAEESRKVAMRKAFRPDTETLDNDRLDQITGRVDTVLQDFVDITGYFRAGYGQSDAGGPQRAFGIPDIGGTKYRLGNEAENYGELAFGKTFFLPGAFDPGHRSGEDGPIAHANVRLSFVNPYSDYGSNSGTDFGAPEVWASVGNILPDRPDMKVWAGNRFYRRHDIHINDFYFYNMSGGGGGIEDFVFGPGKFALAWIGDGDQSTIYDIDNQPDPSNLAGFSKSSIDLRYYDFPLLGGTGEVGLAYALAESGVDANGNSAEDSRGVAVNVVRTKEGFLDTKSLHKTSVQIGSGPAKTFTSGFESFTNADGTYVRPDPDDSWRVRLTDQWVVNPNDSFSLGTAAVYQYTDFSGGITQQWASLGARPIVHFTPSFGLALEAGVDWVSQDPGSDDGFLGKITLAPQISFGDDFFSRPVIRGFLTYGIWSDGFSGLIGGPDYNDATSGWSYGVQMESWW